MFEWISIVLVFLLDEKVAQVFSGSGIAYLRQNQQSFGTQMKTALLNVSTIKVLWQAIWDTGKWELVSILYFLQISGIPRNLKEAFSKKHLFRIIMLVLIVPILHLFHVQCHSCYFWRKTKIALPSNSNNVYGLHTSKFVCVA